MIKNTAGTVHFFVINTATGLGVAGLTVGGGSFTTIKLSQDGTLGADIKGTISLVDLGAGFYCFDVTGAQANYDAILPVIVPASATQQAYGICVYTETAARAGNQMDLVNAPNSTAVSAIQNGLATPGAAMDLVDTLKNKSGSSGYDRTTDSMEALGEKPSSADIADAVLDEAKGEHSGLLAGVALDSTVSKPGTAQTITANQAVNVAQWGGANIATPAVTGEPVVTLDATQTAYSPAKAGDAMDLVDALKNKSGASGYDRTTDSLEAIGEHVSAPVRTITEDSVFNGEYYNGSNSIIHVNTTASNVTVKIRGGHGHLQFDKSSAANTLTFELFGFDGYVELVSGSQPENIVVNAWGVVGEIINNCVSWACGSLTLYGGVGYIPNPTHWTTITNHGFVIYENLALDSTVSKPGTAQTISSNSDITSIKASVDIIKPLIPACIK